MNDPFLVISKLEDLARASMLAESEFDTASIYGATRALITDVIAGTSEQLPQLGENIERARWSICAILGYDITNGHSKDQHISWVFAALVHLRDGLGK